jgi:hypothetical protein
MAVTIVTRAGKGSALTNTEMDANFTNLESAVEAIQAGAFADAAPVGAAGAATGTFLALNIGGVTYKVALLANA